MSKLIVEAITEYYGKRCPDFDAECFCCKAWAEFDRIRHAARTAPEVRRQALDEALQAIKSIPTPLYVETIYGHQDAYRAVEALIIAEPSHDEQECRTTLAQGGGD